MLPWLILYLIALPLWLPPVIMALRSGKVEASKRPWVVGLAVLSPFVAGLSFQLVDNYCGAGSSATGIGEGALWPQCPNAHLAWLIIFLAPTVVGAAAWLIALRARRAFHHDAS